VKRIKELRLRGFEERSYRRREAEMVKNKAFFGQIMEERDNPAFFKILRREDHSTEMMVSLITYFLISLFS